MTILLINNNPIVSRIFALCQEEDAFDIEETSDIASIQGEHHDIVFVDDASYLDNVASYLLNTELKYKVIISYRDTEIKGFDKNIQKPFLPLEILSIIQNVSSQTRKPSSILNPKDIVRIKELLLMDEEKEDINFIEKEQDNSKTKKAIQAEDLALIEAIIRQKVLAMKPKKIQKFLKGKAIKMKIQLEDKA